ncbi:ATPase [Nocardia australiensis]|uniref:ATPase n=1 Tax=Nocardia australiensis TaxID=2887191 RepID=UPI001D13B908|nr:ATPase [Nocardia australiensis]
MTVELFVSDDTMSTERRTALAERILRELTTEDSAPDSVMDKARELTHVMVRTPDVWVTGGPDRTAAPRYVVRVIVPGAWSNSSEFGATVIPAITRAIAATEPDTDRLTRQPHCLVQIVGLREHAIGTLGRAMTSTDITKLMTEDYRHTEPESAAPDGFAIDPVCGMTVELATARFTASHQGADYAFCAPVCRKVFIEEHAIPE